MDKLNLNLRQTVLLNAFSQYLSQAVLSTKSTEILDSITKYDYMVKLFVDYFDMKFNPKIQRNKEELFSLEDKIEEEIKKIENTADNKILNLVFSLLKSLLRTNYFMERDTLAFKINTKEFSKNLEGLQPNIENFIFHEDFCGIHLRMSKVSRGGLRWSNRHEDYRQEIKSLMITQEGKNSIIIPDGAKGGFVINKEEKEITKDYFKKIYSSFINANLDLVDNLIDGKVIRDENIIAYDEDDTYFVVAADKGTSSMSDVANNIAIKRGYWLKDAFASGGSNGYGHKDLGITARGSIMSSKRFFIQDGIDIYKDVISLVGIGSMNGDVFGNGLIESDKFKLLGAISHKEIFIDPNPNVEKSFIERKRLFNADNSSWSNYDKNIISKGGGVFYRSDKEIKLSNEIKNLLKTKKDIVSGEELASMLLCMEVDLFYNGGVGTYVKASYENSDEIGDSQNKAVRINGNDLKAKVVCEGGNLGFTQRGRIEYALNGGKINMDAIDNSAGVHTSDYEVNLKILLYKMAENKIIKENEIPKILKSLSDELVKLVLQSNHDQALVICLDEENSKKDLEKFIKLIDILEKYVEVFDRKSFYIPENIKEVVNENGSIVRPVLSILLSYSKIFLKGIILKSNIVDEEFSLEYLYKYFPESFVKNYKKEILSHPLKKEIIATKMADNIINTKGVSFISDYEDLGYDEFILKIK